MSTDPVIEETGFGSETKVTYPASGNTYRINQYAQDAGGGFFATLPDRTTVDLEDTLDASIQAVGRIESGAATDPEAPDLQLAGLDGLDREFAEMDSAAAPQQRDIAGGSVQQPPPDIVSGDVDLTASVEERAAQVNAKAGQTQQQIGGDDDYVVPRLGGTAALVQQIAGKGQAPQVSFNNGESQVTLQSMSEYYNPQTLDDSQPVKAALNAVINAVERGLPADVMDTLTGFYVYQEGQDGVPDDASAAYFRQNNSIGFGINALESRAATPEGARGLINTVAHEVWHAADTKKGYTENLPGLRAEVVVGQDGKVSVDMGAVTTELFDAWDSNSELGQFFDYPFGHLYQQAQDSGGNTAEISNSLKREVFAQLGAVYIANPKLLKDNAPKAYKIMRDLQADPRPVQEIRDARKRAEAETPLTRSAEVQGDVRSPTGTGIVQVSDEGGAGSEGDASGPVGTAGQELGGAGIDQDGDQSGRVLREELDDPEFERGQQVPEENFERLQDVDDSYNEAKVRSLSQLQQRIPLNERIAGDYEEGQPLTPVTGGKFSDLDLNNRGEGLSISQQDLDAILDEAVTRTDTGDQGQAGSLARETVERLGINANTVEFWDRALRLSDNARYWYEVSAESMRETLPDLTDAEIRQFISVVAATSPVANPFVNMHRALATYANHLQGKPIDNDLVIQKGVTDALKTADLEGLKTGSFGGTMQLVLGMAKPTLSTNDRQVAATFNTDGEEIGKNPILYEVMSRFYIGLRDYLNNDLPEGAQPFETWQLQALGWVEQRYKNEFLEAKKSEGMSDEEAQSAYQNASQEEVAGGTNDVDDYSMSLLRRDDSGRRDRKGAIQVLEEAGIPVPDDKITKDILLDPRVPAALSPTTSVFREKRVVTAEINSLRNEIGAESRRVYDAAIREGNTKIADEYHGIFATLLNKSSKGDTNPFNNYFRAFGLSKGDARPTRVSVPTKQNPLTVGGSYEGDISPNIRVPVPAEITGEQLNVVMTSLSKQWDQDAVPAAHVIDVADGLRDGYTETSQVFVETLDVLSREQIEAFAAALPEGSEINFTRYPNGYEFNVFTFDQETFDPATPNPQDVGAAANAMLAVSDIGIKNIDVKYAQFQPAGYSEIDNYDEVFAEFEDSLYNEQAQGLVGKVQRKIDGRLKDLTEKQIVKELRRKSPSELLNSQSNARIQRANGVIKQRLGYFQQAEKVAQGLASERDTKLKLFTQKNAKKVNLDTPEFERTRPPQSRDPRLEQAVQDRIDRNISAEELNQIMEDAGRPVHALSREEAEEIVTLPSDEKVIVALQKTNTEKKGPSKETYFESYDLQDGELVASRLDIPAYDQLPEDQKTNIVTVHEPKKSLNPSAAGKRKGYTKTIRLKNVSYNVSPKGAVKIGTGKVTKSPIATMQGNYVEATHEQNLADYLNAIDDPNWTQVSMNPRRHSMYYTVDTQEPVLSSGDAIQVGNFIVAKHVELGNIEEFDFQRLSSGTNPEANFNLQDEVELEARLANKVNENFREKVVDRYERWRTVEDAMARELGLGRLPAELSFRDAENLMHSRAEDQLQKFEDKYITGIADLAREFDLTVDQIGLYLLAKHAPERNAQMLQKERDRREKRLAQLEKQLEDSVSDTMPDGSPAIAEKIEILNNEPFRHIETGSGLTNEQAQKVIDNTVAAGNQSQYEQIATAVYKMLDDMRQNMVDKGLLDEETRNDWQETYEFYVPLKGFLDAEGANTSNPRAKGFNIQGSESMKARGRVTLPQNPLLNAFKDAEEKIVRAEKNFAAQKLLKLLQKFEAPGEWSVWSNRNRPDKRYDPTEKMSIDEMKRATREDDGMPMYVQVKRGGQTFFIELKDARLNRQIQEGNAKALNQSNGMIDFGIRNLRRFQNFRRNVIINWNPSWFFINPLRDIETGLAFLLSEQSSATGRVKNKQLINAVFNGWAKSGKAYYDYKRGKQPKDDAQREIFQYIDDFIADGAPTGLATSKSLEEIQRSLEKTMPREVKVRGKTVLRAGSRGKLGEWRDAALDWVEHANQSSENAIRLSTYIEARKAGTPRLDAATLAKDLTVNFNRKGEWSSTIDTGYLFFNAAIQGNVNIKDAIQADGIDPKVKGAMLTATAARKLAMGLIGFGFARTMANIMFSDDDDDDESRYADFSKFKLASTQAIVIGETAFGAPLPYGWGWFDNVGRIFAEQMMGVRDPAEGAADMLSVTAHHFAPRSLHSVNDDDDSIAQAWQAGSGLLPDVLMFGTEQAMNVNFFGSPIVLPTPFNEEDPASSVSKRGTLELFKSFASTVNEWTGGTKFKSGVIDMSPDRLQHMFDFMLGGLGRFGTDAFDTAQKTYEPQAELKNADVPIWRNFVYNPSEYNDQFRYYDNRSETKSNLAQWEDSDSAERRRLVEKDSAELYTRLPMMMKAADKKLKANRKEIRRLEGLTQGDRRAIALKVRELEAENQLIYDKFNKAFKAAND